jgi:Phage protein Gp138 N-terminal domain
MRVSMPGVIQSFDDSSQTADVLPVLIGTNTVAGIDLPDPDPVLPGVPVAFVGGGGFAATFPVAPGDPCLVIFCDLAIGDWVAQGGAVQPWDTSRHTLNGAVALLGVRSRPGALTEFDPSRAVFGNHGPRVACDGSAVHLGVAHLEPATQDAIRGTTHLAALNTLFAAISAAVKVIPTGGAAASSAIDTAIGTFNAQAHTTPLVKTP